MPTAMKKKEHTDVIPLRAQADLNLIKIETEQFMTLARMEPIDYAEVRDEMIRVFDAFPEFCEEAIYCKPVGKDQNTGEQVLARNLSIRAAEELARLIGFNRVTTDVSMIDEYHAQITATFVDYATGRLWMEKGIASKRFKTRQGATVVMSDDRFWNTIVGARKSILIREAILRCMPAGLKKELFEAADFRLTNRLDPKTVQKIVAQFGAKGVTLEQIEERMEVPSASWTPEHRKILLGFWQAIASGEATIEEIFPPSEGGEPKGDEGPTEPKKSRSDEVAEKLGPPDESPSPEPPKKGKPALVEKIDMLILDCEEAQIDLTSIPVRCGLLDLSRKRLEGLPIKKLEQIAGMIESKIAEGRETKGDTDGAEAEAGGGDLGATEPDPDAPGVGT